MPFICELIIIITECYKEEVGAYIIVKILVKSLLYNERFAWISVIVL